MLQPAAVFLLVNLLLSLAFITILRKVSIWHLSFLVTVIPLGLDLEGVRRGETRTEDESGLERRG